MYCADYEKISKDITFREIINNVSNDRCGYIKDYREAIKIQDEIGLLTNSKDAIILSCIHMFCNRFKGDREWEEIVMACVRHCLYDLKAFKNARGIHV